MLNRDYMNEMSKCNTGIFLHTTQYYSNFVASNYNTILKKCPRSISGDHVSPFPFETLLLMHLQ